jgi:hypothetical protein
MPTANILMFISLITLNLLLAPTANAHLMVAQHGTLNFLDNTVFMAISLPISAFENIDDNHNGQISMLEFNHNRAAIMQQVDQGLSLQNQQGDLPLHGVMLSPVMPHNSGKDTISQLTVMGQFSLGSVDERLVFKTQLFGEKQAQQLLEITATHKAKRQRQVFELSPSSSTETLFVDIEHHRQ